VEALRVVWILAIAYWLGAIPFGYIIGKLYRNVDVRYIESGRTGTTNTIRAVGFWPGALTAVLDVLKGASTVWLAKCVAPDVAWVHMLAPIVAIIGHNYSLILAERDETGRIRVYGGAGGAPAAGGALGLWAPSLLYILAVGLVLFFVVGYASVTTMSVPLVAGVVFAYQAAQGNLPWVYVLYAVLAEALLLWALRPNIRRLLNGTERVVGLRAWYAKRRAAQSKS